MFTCMRVYQEPKTSKKHPAHKIYPYLSRDLPVTRPNQVWCTDITHIPPLGRFALQIACRARDAARVPLAIVLGPMADKGSPGGHHGLVQSQGPELAAVKQFAARPPSVRGPCRTDAGFCVEALKDALARYGPPEIFNSDQGSQFTSTDFTQVLLDATVKISMPLGDCAQSPVRIPTHPVSYSDNIRSVIPEYPVT